MTKEVPNTQQREAARRRNPHTPDSLQYALLDRQIERGRSLGVALGAYHNGQPVRPVVTAVAIGPRVYVEVAWSGRDERPVAALCDGPREAEAWLAQQKTETGISVHLGAQGIY